MNGEAPRVVVTGLGCVSPCGVGVQPTWSSMIEARSGLGRVTRFDASDLPSQVAGEVDDLDVRARLGRKAEKRLGRFMQFAVVAADEAMRDAGFDVDAHLDGGSPDHWPDPDRFGVYIGSGIGGFPEIVEQAHLLPEEGAARISPLFIPRSLSNIAAGHVAIRMVARGPSLCVATACAVGNHAIGEAFRLIRLGEADVVIAGGTEAALSPLGFGGFMTMRALTRRNDEPATASRPFDRDRDGFVMSEGAGLVVLESEAHARARGARVYCELAGYAATTDAHHVTAPAPGHAGAARCMQLAMRSAGVRPEQVAYVNAHGTSTPMNDPAEVAAIRTVFGDHADRLMVSSTKGVTGHLLGAAGGVEAVATSLAVHHGIVPPTAHLDTPDPDCDLDHVAHTAREARLPVALSNGFGFGGTNAVLVFREF
jgi:3-oxoacyl-[acyl-carrier-protein] synthase II